MVLHSSKWEGSLITAPQFGVQRLNEGTNVFFGSEVDACDPALFIHAEDAMAAFP